MLPVSTMVSPKRNFTTTPLCSLVKSTAKKINAQQGFPWSLSIQPVSRGWIGLDAEMRRGDTPIRQVNEKYITKNKQITNRYAQGVKFLAFPL